MDVKKIKDIECINGFNQIMSALIRDNNLNITNQEEFDKFFPDFSNPIFSFENVMENLSVLNHTDKFIKEIKKLNKNESICIIGDYDCDGIFGTVILLYALQKYGFTDVNFYIPNRLYEEYGFKEKAFNFSRVSDANVLITVDNGISCKPAVDKALEMGKKVIITDHHIPGELVPENVLIIDPKYNNDKFQESCGAMVILKLVYSLFKEDNLLNKLSLQDLFPLAGIATVADMMTMFGENRYIVSETLRMLTAAKPSTTQFKFLRTLLIAMGGYNFVFDVDSVATEELISFYIAPTVNAVSRVNGNVESLVFDIMSALKSKTLIPSRTSINYNRKNMTSILLNKFKEEPDYTKCQVVVFDADEIEFNIKGIMGLTANQIGTKLGKVVLVGYEKMLVEDGEVKHIIDCSGRSLPGYNLFEGIERISKLHPEFEISYGGHAMAMGIRFLEKYLKEFKDALEADILNNSTIVERSVYEYSPEYESEIIGTLSRMAPFGSGWKPLLFRYSGNLINFDRASKNAIINKYNFKYIPSYGEDMSEGREMEVLFNITFENATSSTFRVRKGL